MTKYIVKLSKVKLAKIHQNQNLNWLVFSLTNVLKTINSKKKSTLQIFWNKNIT